MRIVTWNLCQGAGRSLWSHLQAELQADVLLLQEAVSAPKAPGVAWQTVPGGKWGSALIATRTKVHPIPVPGYEGWVVGGEIESATGPVALFSLHAPSSTSGALRRSYSDEVVTILGLIRQAVQPGVQLVIGGDFNFTLGERHASEAQRTSPKERQALKVIADLGLVSCWAAAHPGEPLPQTLRWTGDRTPGRTTPYHCDGILVPVAWSEGVQCEIHVGQTYMVSDHNPVSATVIPRATPAPPPTPPSGF